MRLPLGCIRATPDPDHPGHSLIQAVIEGDLQGSLPQWVWAIGIKQAAYSFVDLRKLMPKYVEENPEAVNQEPIEQ